MNPAMGLKLLAAKAKFDREHPKFSQFITDLIRNGLEVDSTIEITITRPGKNPVTANMRVKESDLELIRSLKEMQP